MKPYEIKFCQYPHVAKIQIMPPPRQDRTPIVVQICTCNKNKTATWSLKPWSVGTGPPQMWFKKYEEKISSKQGSTQAKND